MKKAYKNKYTILAIMLCLLLFGYVIYTRIPEKNVQVSSKITKKIKKKNVIQNPIDFQALKEINPDVYAYIYSKDIVDTPVLQHPSDDSHYLSYTLEGSYAYPGAVYSENVNALDFTDPNTILYGHNDIITHQMFNGILQLQDKTFFETHRYMYVYLPQEVLQYEIIAAYIQDDRHVYYEVDDWKDQEQFNSYLQQIGNKQGNHRSGVAYDASSTILTLSTCTEGDNNRFLVQAVLNKRIECPQKTQVEWDATLVDSKT